MRRSAFAAVDVVAITRRNIASYGLTSRLVSVDQMAVERGAVLDRGFEDEAARAAVLEAFCSAARQGIAQGAETVIPAGGIVMALLALANVHEIDSAPIVNGLMALVKVAENAVGMRRLTGTFTSKKLTYAPPRGDLLADIRRAYGAHVYPGAH